MSDASDDAVHLEWEGPYTFVEGLDGAKRLPEESGVYLWTLQYDGEHLVHYVGSSANVRARQRRHVYCFLGGECLLPTFEDGAFTGWQPEESPDLSSGEDQYRRAALFLKDPRLVDQARQYLLGVRIFVALTERYHDAERALQVAFKGYHQDKDRQAATRGCPPVSLRGSRGKDVTLVHSTPCRIPGVSDWSRE